MLKEIQYKDEYRPRLTNSQYKRHLMFESGRNVLVVGDLHEPFSLDAYFDFIKEVSNIYSCDEVIFIGDIIDSHYSSYHEQNPDGFSAGEELERAVSRLNKWYKEFPEATVTLGNHDNIVLRKAFSTGLSKRWIKDFNEVLEVPRWKFVENIELDKVVYTHGTGQSGENPAAIRAINYGKSHVMGHVHTSAGIRFAQQSDKTLFGMQVGCGVDESKYAFQYAKDFPKKQQLACGVVLFDGTIPMLIPFSK
jgi:UDP-2,3-diacylglucosamine pyrophosphatase LpxH